MADQVTLGILWAAVIIGIFIVLVAVVDRVICFFLDDPKFASQIAFSVGLISASFWLLARSR